MSWSASHVSCFLLHSTGETQPHENSLIARETREYALLRVQKNEMVLAVSIQSLAQASLLGIQYTARSLGSVHLLTSSIEQDNSGFFFSL